jgi:hypothetical protein
MSPCKIPLMDDDWIKLQKGAVVEFVTDVEKLRVWEIVM